MAAKKRRRRTAVEWGRRRAAATGGGSGGGGVGSHQVGRRLAQTKVEVRVVVAVRLHPLVVPQRRHEVRPPHEHHAVQVARVLVRRSLAASPPELGGGDGLARKEVGVDPRVRVDFEEERAPRLRKREGGVLAASAGHRRGTGRAGNGRARSRRRRGGGWEPVRAPAAQGDCTPSPAPTRARAELGRFSARARFAAATAPPLPRPRPPARSPARTGAAAKSPSPGGQSRRGRESRSRKEARAAPSRSGWHSLRSERCGPVAARRRCCFACSPGRSMSPLRRAAAPPASDGRRRGRNAEASGGDRPG